MKDRLVLASVCMCSTEDKQQNIETAFCWVRKAAERGADWVLLPEVFAYHGPYDKIYHEGEAETSALIQRLSDTARELGICLFAGSFGERPVAGRADHGQLKSSLGHDRVYNTSFVFNRNGQEVAKYRKTHLFNLLDAAGQAVYCESDGFLAGDELITCSIDGFQIGMGICYDLRFPSFFEALARKAALDVIVLPSAFTLQTGMDHWELLLRARAVEQQCYVFASNQVGNHGRGRASYGHSMIVDPWGYVIANTGAVEGLAIAEISRKRIDEIRSKLPALNNRRPEIYCR